MEAATLFVRGCLALVPYCETVEQAQQAWALYLQQLNTVLPYLEAAASESDELRDNIQNLLRFKRYLEQYRDATALGRLWDQSDMLAKLRALQVEMNTATQVFELCTSRRVNDQLQQLNWSVGELRDMLQRTICQDLELNIISLRFGELGDAYWNGARVSVKAIVEDGGGLNEGMKEAIRHELQRWHKSRHPHVLEVYGVCLAPQPAVVFQYVEHSIAQYFRSPVENRRFVWRIFVGATEGLERLHRGGIVLDRFTIEDIVAAGEGHAWLNPIDLSAVMAVGNCMSLPIKETAPECRRGSRPTVASNVYTIGVCLLEALSYCTQPKRDVTFENMRLVIEQFWPKLSPLVDELILLLRSMTSKQPTRRPQTAHIIEQLKKFADLATDIHIPICAELRETLRGPSGELERAIMNYGNEVTQDPAMFQSLIDRGVIAFLVEATSTGSDKQKRFAICALRNIAYNNEQRAELVAQAGVIPILIKFVTKGTLDQQTAAVGAILNLALVATRSVPMLKQAEVKEALELVTTNYDPATANAKITKLLNYANKALEVINKK